MKNQRLSLFSALFAFGVSSGAASSFSVVRSFGLSNDIGGFEPRSALVQDANGVLYGTTSTSEGSFNGTVFKVNPDGTGFSVLMSFLAPVNFTNATGANPYGGLVLSGETLYGTTYNGGAGGCGTVFSINTDGTGFDVLTNFPSAAYLTNVLGAHPYAGLARSGTTLYGTTQGGGSGGNGTVFSLNTDGTGLTVLKNFSATELDEFTFLDTNSDGAVPDGTLVYSSGMLYGTTLNGGSGGYGTIFAIDTTTLNFTNYYTFTDGSDGGNPHAGLTLYCGLLYGAASSGGNGSGTLFVVNTNGSNFNAFYAFTDGYGADNPDGNVVVAGATVYGTTYDGGSRGFGSVFAVGTNGTGYTNLWQFDGTVSGGYPLAGLILSEGTLYGSTAGITGQEDSAGENGTLFAVNTNGAGFTNIYTFVYSDGVQPYGGLLSAGGTLYGATYQGGASGNGAIYQMNPDGSGYSIIKSFSAFSFNPLTYATTNADGANPQSGLVMSSGTLYGTAYYGGSAGFGTVFAVNTNGSFTNLYSFSGGNDGANPQGGLVFSGGVLYGTTVSGGSNNNGVVFAISANGSNFVVLKTFSATTSGTNFDGANPYAGLILAGSTLYGTAFNGGVSGAGDVFALSTSGANFTNLYSFTGGNDGANPYAGLALAGGALYGTTYYGGSNGNGGIYMVTTNGSTFSALKSFSAIALEAAVGLNGNSDGANPYGGLAVVNNTLYGTTVFGGSNGVGTAFSVNTNGAGFATLYNFDGTTGADPYGTMVFSGTALYGTTLNGGNVGDGTVFSVNVLPQQIPLNIQLAGRNVILTWTNPAFSLQAAPSVTGVYAVVSGATSPFTNPITGPQQYFRLATASTQLPAVSLTPAALTVASGGSAVLTATVTGSQLSYQWQLNGGSLNGADIIGSQTGSSLTISPAKDADAGNYTVQVSNPYGIATSATTAELVVVDQPTFVGGPGPGHGQFALSFSGPMGRTYRIFSSTNLALPLSNWSQIAGGQFAPGVNSFADANATNTSAYYCIVVP